MGLLCEGPATHLRMTLPAPTPDTDKDLGECGGTKDAKELC